MINDHICFKERRGVFTTRVCGLSINIRKVVDEEGLERNISQMCGY